jgi:hypothetical protein
MLKKTPTMTKATMTSNSNDVLVRVKNLQAFEVTTTVPTPFNFKGPVPFDVVINDNVAVCSVLALNLEEATTIVESFFNSKES